MEEYDPRPEWYFFFLFELLRIFKTPELLLFATVIIPTLWMILLIAWPFLDRRPERRISKRPIAMAIGASVPIVLLALTWYGSKAPAVGEASTHPGAFAVQANGCGTCHTHGRRRHRRAGSRPEPRQRQADLRRRPRPHHERRRRHAGVRART